MQGGILVQKKKISLTVSFDALNEAFQEVLIIISA
jgi:hypothetical protein